MKRNFKAPNIVVQSSLFNALQKDQAGFDRLQTFLNEWTGINMNLSQVNIVKMANRLSNILTKYGLSKYGQYLKLLKTGDPALISEFISAMTTNTTSFFREKPHFESLRVLIPTILEYKKKAANYELRVWCAAASTGEEPYTIAITLLESLPAGVPLDIKILATDIDTDVLNRAATGLYDHKRLAEIPPAYLKKYFHRVKAKGNQQYQVASRLQTLIRFAPFNLHTSKYPFRFPFDIVFCRNVLIYFSRNSAAEVVRKLIQTIGQQGFLFVGHSEVGYIRSPLLQMVKYGVYQKLLSEQNCRAS